MVCSFLELDVLYIKIQNKFQWIGGDKNEMSAVHLEILTVTVSSLCQHVYLFPCLDGEVEGRALLKTLIDT